MEVIINLIVSIKLQKLSLFEDSELLKVYDVSISKYGIGNQQDSFCTPLGKHEISEKMGAEAPLKGVLRWGKYTGEIAENIFGAEGDLITTRALRLKGFEPELNLGAGIDSEERGIWIHGTAQESKIGTPASHGCIRMKNVDMLELFDLVRVGDEVDIII